MEQVQQTDVDANYNIQQTEGTKNALSPEDVSVNVNEQAAGQAVQETGELLNWQSDLNTKTSEMKYETISNYPAISK